MKLLGLFMQLSHFTIKFMLFTFKNFRISFLKNLKMCVFADFLFNENHKKECPHKILKNPLNEKTEKML